MKQLLTVTLLTVIFFTVAHAQVIHVPGDSSTIQSAINAAGNGDTVLVAEGTYFENIDFKGKAIVVASHYIMDGDTTHISKTIIDGSQPLDPEKGSTVFMISGEDSTSVIKGFTITGGTGWIHEVFFGMTHNGGGINIFASGGKIERNIIKGNSVINDTVWPGAGGICADPYFEKVNIVIRNNVIKNNSVKGTAYSQAGGILVGCEDGFTLVEGNDIHHNTAICTGTYKANAGGLMMYSLQPWNATMVIRNNIIRDNEVHCVASQGGGIFLTYPPFTEPQKDKKSGIEIYNNLITNNYCEQYGGGIAFWDQNNLGENWLSPSPVVFNNTVVGNKSKQGAGIFNFNNRVLLYNNILWNDLSVKECSEIYIGKVHIPMFLLSNKGVTESHNNNIQGGWLGEGNINEDPEFTGNLFELTEDSPCVGAGLYLLKVGDKDYYAPKSDFNGNIRYNNDNNCVDIGAIESPYLGCTTEIENRLQESNEIFVFPNPVIDYLSIATHNLQNYSVELINLNGQSIYIKESHEPTMQLDLSGFKSGVYFVRVKSKDFSWMEKIIHL